MVEDSTLNLRPYTQFVIRQWRLIASLTLIAALAATLVSLTTPVEYEAILEVAVPNILKTSREARAYTQLATSNAVLAELDRGLKSNSTGTALDRTSLSGRLLATAGPDPGIITLRVRDKSREQASAVASQWAQAFVLAANATISSSKDDSVLLLESQSSQAYRELQRVEEDLLGLETGAGMTVVQTELSTQQSILSDLYRSKSLLEVMSQDARNLRDKLSRYDPSSPSDLGGDLALQSLQLRVLAGGANVSLQLQLPHQQASQGTTSGELLAQAESIASTIAGQQSSLNREIATTQKAIEELQARLRSVQVERSILMARRAAVDNTIKELQLKIALAKAPPARILAQSPQVDQESRSIQRNILAGTILGLMLGMIGALGCEYYRLKTAGGAPFLRPRVRGD